MKMVKKILLGMTAAALVLGLAGCKGITVGDQVNGEIIKGTTTKAYLGDKDDGYTNEGNDWAREMQLFATKHYGAFAALTVEDENPAQKSGGNGVLGYVFNYSENTNGTVNFAIAGYRWYDGKHQTYISQFYNIDTSKFSAKNFGCSEKKSAYSSTETGPYEIVIIPTTSGNTFENLESWAKFGADGNSTIGIEVIANDGTNGTKGSYTVNYYGSDKINSKYKLIENSTPDKTVTLSTSVTGYNKKEQTKMGCYVNVYTGCTFKGFWRFSSIKGEDLPVEGFEQQ